MPGVPTTFTRPDRVAVCAPNFALRNLLQDCGPTEAIPDHERDVVSLHPTNMVKLQHPNVSDATVYARVCLQVVHYLGSCSGSNLSAVCSHVGNVTGLVFLVPTLLVLSLFASLLFVHLLRIPRSLRECRPRDSNPQHPDPESGTSASWVRAAKRSEWDSNPRGCYPYSVSNRAQSATMRPLQSGAELDAPVHVEDGNRNCTRALGRIRTRDVVG